MSRRLQVIMDESEYAATKELARRNHQSTAEWVRAALREARRQADQQNPAEKLKAIQKAASYSFPVCDIEQMLEEIETGYRVESH